MISNGSKTAEVLDTAKGQAVLLPAEFRFDTEWVAIRRDGDSVILEPLKPTRWPPGFFESIHIDDPAFVRPNQGELPPPPSL
jgi:virulence-associated protein VagC